MPPRFRASLRPIFRQGDCAHGGADAPAMREHHRHRRALRLLDQPVFRPPLPAVRRHDAFGIPQAFPRRERPALTAEESPASRRQRHRWGIAPAQRPDRDGDGFAEGHVPSTTFSPANPSRADSGAEAAPSRIRPFTPCLRPVAACLRPGRPRRHQDSPAPRAAHFVSRAAIVERPASKVSRAMDPCGTGLRCPRARAAGPGAQETYATLLNCPQIALKVPRVAVRNRGGTGGQRDSANPCPRRS